MSPSVTRKSSPQAVACCSTDWSGGAGASGAAAIRSVQPRSQVVTCLMRPPMLSVPAVGARRICSSVRPWATVTNASRCWSR